jgi:hypothetical protein
MARGRLFVWLGLTMGLTIAAAVPVAAATLPVPAGFRLSASNGYSISALAFDGEQRGEDDGVLLFVGQKDQGVLYVVRKGVAVTESTVFAPLGKLGSIDLHFVPTGKPRTETSVCGQQSPEFDSGFYEGRFDFEGEEGYTKVHRARVRGEVRLEASLICATIIEEGVGGHSPGAQLQVRRRSHRGGVEFEATKNSPSRPARFHASVREWREGLAIERQVSAEAGAGAFEFDVPAQKATLQPPSPFTGSARFLRGDDGRGRLQGSLVADFPGRSGVSLGASRGSLQRWVQNPSHPFRPAMRRDLFAWL